MLRITLCLLAAILTPSACDTVHKNIYQPPVCDGRPVIGGASVYGTRPATPFLYTIAAAGRRPMTFTAKGLPGGLTLDRHTGIITGQVDAAGAYTVTVGAANAGGRDTAELTLVIGERLALTPPMGWMSWNQFGPDISETLIRQVADAMVESGMRDAGYQYIFIDDHWHGKRGADGIISPHPDKFPGGMKALSDYVHSKGLKLGIYSDAAEHTCGGEPGSLGYEDNDAGTYAEWGMDYLKYDYCGAPKDRAAAVERYRTMADALNRTGRSIVFGVCEWGPRQPWLWAADSGGHLWRTTWDIRDSWLHRGLYDSGHAGILTVLDKQVGLEQYAAPGRWNDPDMLVVGLRGKGKSSSHDGANGCTEDEYRSQMSLWCLLAAPLYASCDVRTMDEATRSILTNTEAIAVNQDPLGKQARRIAKTGDLEVWGKPLSGGQWAVGLLNRSGAPAAITADWKAIGIEGAWYARDLWRHETLGVFTGTLTREVKSHETVLLRLWPKQD
ncbi:MAG: putative Ig domain-containing protein [Planctomycetales bacterium]|nr:putative Ig domain-containing protein [Planctomycetales bacterium]